VRFLQNILLLLPILFVFAAISVFAQVTCTVIIGMANHNRYAYDTTEECWPNAHSVGIRQ